MSVSLLLAAALPVLLAGFVLGWAARRADDRAYIESRELYWADQLAQLRACEQGLAPAAAVRIPADPAPVVVHVHLPALYPSWPHQQIPAAHVVSALERGHQ